VKSYKHLVVVEGYFGAIRLHGERIPAVGLMGSSISEEQVALLKEHCRELRHITVMLDGDAAGREAADKVAAALARDCPWWVRIVTLPEGLQPNTVPGEELLRLIGRSS
jgi:DNA primase